MESHEKTRSDTYERKTDETISLEVFHHIELVENKKFIFLSGQRLLDAVIWNTKLKFMESYMYHKSRNNTQDNNRIHEFINIVNPEFCSTNKVVAP